MSTDPCITAEAELWSPEAALRLILADITPLSRWERLPLKQALGRVLFQDVSANIDLPPFTNSAMDGYALRAADVADGLGLSPNQINRSLSGVEANAGFDSARPAGDTAHYLTPIGTSWAGRPYQGSVAAGQCVRIFTGAMLPDGADSVVMQEDVALEDGVVRVSAPVHAGQHVRQAGEELRSGDIALTAGKRLTPADLALLAALGQCEVCVYAQPRVAFLSSGDELRGAGSQLASGQIYDSNRYALYGLLREAGVEALDLGTVNDDPDALKAALLRAAALADMLITTGGVSVGEADFVSGVLADIGQLRLWKMAVKPGKPIAFGRIDNAWFFGLPGNPVSVHVGFRLVVQPALAKLAGTTPKPALRFSARTRQAIKKTAGRMEFQRGRLSRDNAGQWWVDGFAAQGSHLLTSMSQADCLMVLAAECAGVAVGDWVEIEPLPTGG